MASPIASNALKARIRSPALLKKLARPEDLMHHFPNGAYIGWSGFTGVGYPKYVCPSLPSCVCFAPTTAIIILAYCRFRAPPPPPAGFPAIPSILRCISPPPTKLPEAACFRPHARNTRRRKSR